MGRWFSAHTHTIYSSLDAIAPPKKIVEKAVLLGHPALAFTDHGNMAGVVQGYKACKAADIPFSPGVEAYLIDPEYDGNPLDPKKGTKVGRFHVGLLALDHEGYVALVKFVSKTHTRPRFNRFARCTLDDLATLGQEAGDHIALTTGCFFGLVQQSLIGDGGMTKAQRIIKMYANWFPHTFVELQNHNIDHGEQEHANGAIKTDNDIVKALHDMADRLSLPVITTQDSHYVDKTERKAHRMMKTMVYGSTEDAFPGDYFHFPQEAFVRSHYKPQQWEASLDGLDHLRSLIKVTIPPLDKYQMHVPQVVKNDAPGMLQTHLKSAMQQFVFEGKKKYEDRLIYELDVINHLGMANYFLMWKRIVEFCRSKRIAIEARGSANGSLVCYLLGITQVDPIVRKTDFERFLSKDRKKPPDIDMDVEDVNRERVITFIQRTWPGSTRIGTWSKLGATEDDKTGDVKGAVLVTYKSFRARQAEAEAKERGANAEGMKRAKQAVYAKLQSLEDVETFYGAQDYDALVELANVGQGVQGNKYGVYKSYGVHAAGVLLSGESVKIEDYVPTMLVASSNTTVTQFDQDDVEEFGLLKNDVLGQATLTVMRVCQQLMGREDPTDFSWIEDDDPDACRQLREGRTDTGIFHYEGFTKAKGGREMGIRSTRDAILGQALYMPGAMDSGQKDLYIRHRRDKEARDSMTYIHPIFETVLKPTYGAFIFQEQVINIMRGLGMDLESINAFFKIVKDSGAGALARNADRIAPLKDKYDSCCKVNGIDKEDGDAAWVSLAGFVAYGFNKAHATGYGIRSYRCAYLKAHYPLEFMTALLQVQSGTKKEPIYAREARRIGIRLLPPDVNVSTSTWTLDRKAKAIRKGLTSIAGIGPSTADAIVANAPYSSVTDLAQRSKINGYKNWESERKHAGAMRSLYDVGAFDDMDEG